MIYNKNIDTSFPERQVRAVYNEKSIRVYQAYSDEIADSTLANNKFVSPPFKMTRMTWIKPSFLWMMYRAGWGFKSKEQRRILAIDLTHDGFLWALSNSCLSSHNHDTYNKEEWNVQKNTQPVRIQWDPERDIFLNKLNYRTIQIGLAGDAVKHYVNDWIVNIDEVTNLARAIRSNIETKSIGQVIQMLPVERPYLLDPILSKRLGMLT